MFYRDKDNREEAHRFMRRDEQQFGKRPPHCDPSVLHAPGECVYCDYHEDWQKYRELARINFTGENDPNKAPCPSTKWRDVEKIHRWGGNKPVGDLTD